MAKNKSKPSGQRPNYAKASLDKQTASSQLDTMRHSLAHIMAAAVVDMFPEAKLGVGPAIENGFYYDFDLPRTLIPEDLPIIEEKMREIIKENLPFEKTEVPIETAIKEAKKKKEIYKLELLNDLKGTSPQGRRINVSFYRTGSFVDLCKGPHVASTGKVGAFKLTKISGAYWRGSENRPMLQRIYGLAFKTQKELEEHLKQMEEAEKRDHRRLGKELDLFSFHPSSPGAVFWHPKGFIIFNELEKFWRKYHKNHGYTEIFTPSLFKKDLWVTSGHWDHYKNEMFSFDVDKETHVLKPMDCPDSIIVYQTKLRSYRDLPIRLNEIGRIFRNELSGTLGGMFRVRQITQDDAHIFCTEDQISPEISVVIKMIKEFYDLFDLSFHAYLSTRPDEHMGDIKTWDKAEKDLEISLKKNKIKYGIKEKDGAFYGPKIDFQINDALGRDWQLATIQLDFQLPRRFKVEYIDKEGKKQTPVMIHRVIFGSFERFIGILIEHLNGVFPLWLAPVQVQIILVSDIKHLKYAKEIRDQLLLSGIRADLASQSESVGKKIREAEIQKIPYMIVVGDKEVKSKKIAVRSFKKGDLGQKTLISFIKEIKKEAGEKK